MYLKGAWALSTLKSTPLQFFADEGLEGCWHPAQGADGMPYPGQRLEARPAEQVARGELIELELLLFFARESERSVRVSMTPSNATNSDAITFLMGPPSSVGVRIVCDRSIRQEF
jgi:hypothetical protein